MSSYQPWVINHLDMLHHNAAVMLWFTNRITQQYHARSEHLVVTLTCFALALAQLSSQVFELLHLIGKSIIMLFSQCYSVIVGTGPITSNLYIQQLASIMQNEFIPNGPTRKVACLYSEY